LRPDELRDTRTLRLRRGEQGDRFGSFRLVQVEWKCERRDRGGLEERDLGVLVACARSSGQRERLSSV
jgi:hypothetical protein